MNMTGTLVNYYFHCKRQCFLAGNRLNMENNCEKVLVGQAIHRDKADKSKHTEVSIENIRLDRITDEYLTEIKKSDSDIEAAKWQLIYYLYVLRNKGIKRKGRLEFVEKKHSDHNVIIVELTEELQIELEKHLIEIEKLIMSDTVPSSEFGKGCSNCSYFEYCFI